MRRKLSKLFLVVPIVALLLLGLTVPAAADVTPAEVTGDLAPGESMTITKTVTTPDIPPVVDILLLEDETGSFGDDIANLQGGTTASDIYDTVVAESPGAQFAVAGFRDYEPPYGSPGDWVYRLLSPMSGIKADWLNGIAVLTAGGGGDGPEAQYDAIVAATTAAGGVGWRDPAATPGVQRVMVVTTDAPFHLPGEGKPHVNNQASTIAALDAQNIIVIGLKAPGSGGELDALAAATGGSVQALSSDGKNIGEAILGGLKELTTDVWWEVTSCDPGLNVTLDPVVYYDVPGGSTLTFEEKISLDDDAPQCNTLTAVVTFYANSYEEGEGAVVGTQKISIKVNDVEAPVISCEEAVNPHGDNIPGENRSDNAKSKAKNPDGFYQIFAEDNCDPEPEIYVGTADEPKLFGPFESGVVIKFTEAPGADPSCKKIGSSNGQAGAVAWHITLPCDPVVTAVDVSGNTATCDGCLVPPPPM